MNPQTYEYVDNQNQLKTIQATSPEEAIRLAPNRASNSGVALYKPTTATPTQPVETQAPPESSPRLGDILGGYTEDAYGKAIEDAYQQSQSYGTDPEEYRRSYINMFQDRINALNQVYDQQLAKAQQEGKGRVGSGTAILARRGLAGSPRGGAIQEGVLDQNRAIEGAIEAERSAAIQAIYGEATQMAVEEARQKRQAKEQGLQTYLDYLKGDADRRSNRAGQAAALLLQQGIDIGELTKDELDKLTRAYKVNSGELSTAYSSALASQAEGELKTAKTKAEIDKINADIAKGKLIELSEGTILYNTETGETFKNPKTSAPSSAGSGAGGGIYSKLDYRTANAVLSQADKFGSSDVVKKYNNIIAASNLIAGVDPNTKNAAEHQAVVYNFAKALDPDSVVREGEYATVKKYSQSLASKYGGELRQAIAGTGFLSPGAIEAIQEATNNRIKAYEPQYNNLKKETANRINNIAGKDVADIVLLDYEQGYQPGGDARTQIEKAGYDYQAIKNTYPNLSDDELLDLIGA